MNRLIKIFPFAFKNKKGKKKKRMTLKKVKD